MLSRNTTLSALTDDEVEAVADALSAARTKSARTALAKLNDPTSFDVAKQIFNAFFERGASLDVRKTLPAQPILIGMFATYHNSNISSVGLEKSIAIVKQALPFLTQMVTERKQKIAADEKAAKTAAKPKKRGKLFVGTESERPLWLYADTIDRLNKSHPGWYYSADRNIVYSPYGEELYRNYNAC